MRVALETLGCKINQYETAILEQELEGRYSLVPFKAEADIYIINTCTVTKKADSESRQLIRRALRRNGKAKTVVTGCYAERSPEEISELGVDAVVCNKAKDKIPSILDDLLKGRGYLNDFQDEEPFICKATFSSQRTRAFLKIQDGCSYRCSYCIVPYVRGRSRSAPFSNVYEEVKALINNGYKEIVLSGIHLGSYGRDSEGEGGIVKLLKEILKIDGEFRIRLSSLDPREITIGLIKLIKSDLRICRHLHIPIQSGDDAILEAMGRNYTSAYLRDLIIYLSSEISDISLGADIMVGFPGELEENFINTYNLLDQLPLSYFHVFSFSPRPATKAYSMKNQIPKDIKEKRSRIIRLLGEGKNLSFKNKQIMKKLDILIENKRDTLGYLSGLSDNYLRVYLEDSGDLIGKIAKVKVKNIERLCLVGERLS